MASLTEQKEHHTDPNSDMEGTREVRVGGELVSAGNCRGRLGHITDKLGEV